MASIRKPGPYNPQKASAYVGKGVLRNGEFGTVRRSFSARRYIGLC
jgi:hypothetical protein